MAIGVLTALTMTTSSEELIKSLALPRDGIEFVIFWIVEAISVVLYYESSISVFQVRTEGRSRDIRIWIETKCFPNVDEVTLRHK